MPPPDLFGPVGLTDAACDERARSCRLFEARTQTAGYHRAVAEFLDAEALAMASADSYEDTLDRMRIFDAVWHAAVLRH